MSLIQDTGEDLFPVSMNFTAISPLPNTLQAGVCKTAVETRNHADCAYVCADVQRLSSKNAFLAKLASDVAGITSISEQLPTPTDLHKVGRLLATLGYTVQIRTGSTTASKGRVDYLRNLKHSFLVVSQPAVGVSDVIVDPWFKDQFEIAKVTARYSAVMQHLPRAFVGRQDQLVSLIMLLCGEMKLAFASQDLEIAPWREQASMLSKWVPAKYSDRPVRPLDSDPVVDQHTTAMPAVDQRKTARLPAGYNPTSPAKCSRRTVLNLSSSAVATF